MIVVYDYDKIRLDVTDPWADLQQELVRLCSSPSINYSPAANSIGSASPSATPQMIFGEEFALAEYLDTPDVLEPLNSRFESRQCQATDPFRKQHGVQKKACVWK
ncbi:hypothetical protein LSTR_LSTR001088 [Laodelphax striatellus]|uniref:Uncharacterized protein n=1 Tax=Laodelphax striatellus TaxID=195883 RepID=A0A482X133_LAOST|nr:hypothetical protein LSTR_LSTR001088 [Laodelphax striatellus]